MTAWRGIFSFPSGHVCLEDPDSTPLNHDDTYASRFFIDFRLFSGGVGKPVPVG